MLCVIIILYILSLTSLRIKNQNHGVLSESGKDILSGTHALAAI